MDACVCGGGEACEGREGRRKIVHTTAMRHQLYSPAPSPADPPDCASAAALLAASADGRSCRARLAAGPLGSAPTASPRGAVACCPCSCLTASMLAGGMRSYKGNAQPAWRGGKGGGGGAERERALVAGSPPSTHTSEHAARLARQRRRLTRTQHAGQANASGGSSPGRRPQQSKCSHASHSSQHTMGRASSKGLRHRQ